MAEKRKLDFYIGSWLIQPQQHRIRGEENAVRIEPKVMDVLLCLAEFPRETVTRDYLLETVWEGTVVTDDVLTRSISELRKIFGDNPRKPRVIETIPKVGYRLLLEPALDHRGDSIPIDVPTLDISSLVKPTSQNVSPIRSPVSWFIAGILIIIVIAFFWVRSSSYPALHSNYVSTPLTSFPGFEGRPVLSPDGKQVAFSWGGQQGDNTDIYVKLVGTESMLRLTDSPAFDFMPAWSPDGTRLAYMKRDGPNCSIWTIAALGGTAQRFTSCGFNIYGDLTWSPDGSYLAYNDRAEEDTSYSIYLVDLETGEKTKLTSPPGHMWGDHDPSFSPDGRWLSFTRSESEGMQDLYLVSLENEEIRQITNESRNISGNDWVDDRHVVFSSNRNGRAAVWLLSIAEGNPTPVNVPDEYAYYPSFSSGRMAYMKGSGETNVWRLALYDSTDAVPFIQSSRWDMHPQYAPDGSRIAFTSNRTGTYEIWVSDSTGQDVNRRTYFNGPFTSTPRWSPDGEQIVFTSRPDGEAQLFILGSNDAMPRQLTRSGDDYLAPYWSGDGRFIYYCSNRSGQWQVWKKEVIGGEEMQLTFDGGFGPRESRDGSSIYYSRQDEPGLWQLDVAGGDPVKILDTIDPRDWGSWSFDDRNLGVYYIKRGQPSLIVYEQLQTGLVDTLLVLEKSIPRMDPALAVSPDNRYLLLGQVERNESDLVLIEQFLQ